MQQEFPVVFAAQKDTIQCREIQMTIRADSPQEAERYGLTFIEMALGKGQQWYLPITDSIPSP